MGWSRGFIDGHPVGYGVTAKCDHPECTVIIDRGLAYACGDEHGCDEIDTCSGYYCAAHIYAHACTDFYPAPESDEPRLKNSMEDELQEITTQAAAMREAPSAGVGYALQMAIEGARLAGATEDQIKQAIGE
jgi:hypothetical protein